MLDSCNLSETLNNNQNFPSSVKSYIDSFTSLTQTENVDEKQYLDSDRKENTASGNSLSNQIMSNDRSNDVPTERIEEINMENIIVVLNKIDKLNKKEFKVLYGRVHGMKNNKVHVCLLSCLTNYGFTELVNVLKMRVEDL